MFIVYIPSILAENNEIKEIKMKGLLPFIIKKIDFSLDCDLKRSCFKFYNFCYIKDYCLSLFFDIEMLYSVFLLGIS